MQTSIVPTCEVFESIINVLHSDTLANSIINTSSDRVVGEPMIGHDIFHGIANNVVKKSFGIIPQLAHELLTQYSVDLTNPAGFNFNGERLAMVAQAYIKCFQINYIDGIKYLVCNPSELPTHDNYPKLSRLLALDLRTSLSLSSFKFDSNYYNQLTDLFLEPNNLDSVINAFFDGCNYSNEILFRIYYLYQEFEPIYTHPIFNNLKRLLRNSITANQLLGIANINAHGKNPIELIKKYIYNSIKLFLSNNQVRQKLASLGNLYDIYTKGELIQYSLISDFQKYYINGSKTNNLLILEHQFKIASGMDLNEYLNGSSAIAFLFEEVYMSDFDISDMSSHQDQLRIKTSQKTSLLETDILKYSCYKNASNAYDITDMTARTGDHLMTISLREEYKHKLKPITDQIDFCMQFYDFGQLSDEEYSILDAQLESLQKELRMCKLKPELRTISDQLTIYYGYCDL